MCKHVCGSNRWVTAGEISTLSLTDILSLSLSGCVCLSLSLCRSISLFCGSTCLSVCLSLISLSLCGSISLFCMLACLPVCLSVCLFVSSLFSVYPSVCLSLCLCLSSSLSFTHISELYPQNKKTKTKQKPTKNMLTCTSKTQDSILVYCPYIHIKINRSARANMCTNREVWVKQVALLERHLHSILSPLSISVSVCFSLFLSVSVSVCVSVYTFVLSACLLVGLSVFSLSISVFVPVYISVQSVCLSVCLSAPCSLSIRLSLCLSVFLCRSFSVSVCLSICLSVCLFLSLSLFVCLSVCLSVFLRPLPSLPRGSQGRCKANHNVFFLPYFI